MNIPRNRPGRRLPARVILFSMALVLAFCMSVQAAVLEGGAVERQVDTPSGVQTQRHLGEDLSTPTLAPTSVPTRSTGTTTQPTPASPQQTPELPVESGGQAPAVEEPAEGGGFLGFLLVGLIVAALGTFVVLMVARSRGKH